MPNATAHRIGAGLVAGVVTAKWEHDRGQATSLPLFNAALATSLGTLPDLIEPALHPNHRQFFHSVTVLGISGYGFYKLWNWEADSDGKKLVKLLGLVGLGAYMTHLVMDATTKKSLPLI